MAHGERFRLHAVRGRHAAPLWTAIHRGARQFVNHGHVEVNGTRVNIPSYRVKEGDVVSLRSKAQNMALVLEAIQSPERDTPEYIDVDHSKMTATFVRTPSLGDIPYAVMMEPNLVVEYYAKN